jgi:hypothetical protein
VAAVAAVAARSEAEAAEVLGAVAVAVHPAEEAEALGAVAAVAAGAAEVEALAAGADNSTSTMPAIGVRTTAPCKWGLCGH